MPRNQEDCISQRDQRPLCPAPAPPRLSAPQPLSPSAAAELRPPGSRPQAEVAGGGVRAPACYGQAGGRGRRLPRELGLARLADRARGERGGASVRVARPVTSAPVPAPLAARTGRAPSAPQPAGLTASRQAPPDGFWRARAAARESRSRAREGARARRGRGAAAGRCVSRAEPGV